MIGPKLQNCFRFLPWLFLIIIGCYLIFGEGLLDLTRGRIHRKAQEMFVEIDGITEARIFLLIGTPEQQTDETFPIRPYGSAEPVFGSVTLTGEQLDTFLFHWRWQSIARGWGAVCHHPAYGFRFYKGTKLVAETSLCWECDNFYVEIWPSVSDWYGFDSTSKQAQDLLKHCDGLLPYARRKNTPTTSGNE